MSDIVPSDTDFDPTIGALQIGVMVSIFLFGLVTVQVFSYYKRFADDSWMLKAFVGVVWLMELTHTALTAHSIYFVTVTKYGEPQFIDEFTVSITAATVLSAIIGPAIQAFFAYRVYKLSQSWIIPIICWVLSLLRCVSLFAVAVEGHIFPSLPEFRKRWLWLLTASLSISSVADVLIAAALSYYLWRLRQRNVFTRTRRLIDHLIFWSIQTGLLTSLATTSMLILFVVSEHYYWMTIFYIIPRLFANSLLASLNARTSRRSMGISSTSRTFSIREDEYPRDIHIEMTKVTDV